jgi:hypothetical protein
MSCVCSPVLMSALSTLFVLALTVREEEEKRLADEAEKLRLEVIGKYTQHVLHERALCSVTLRRRCASLLTRACH